jgi:Recombinase
MPPLTIAAAARLCGCPRSTLQRAIRAGRLHLDAAHCLDPDELTRAGYLATPGARQPHAPAAQQSHPAGLQGHEVLLRDMQRSMERVVDALDRLTTAVQQMQQMQQERSSRTLPPAARTLQPRDIPADPPPTAPAPSPQILGTYDREAAVARMQVLRRQGLSFATIAQQLTAEGIVTRYGLPWEQSSVRYLLRTYGEAAT